MFASAEIVVAQPFEEAEAVWMESPPNWLAVLIERTGKDSFELLDTVWPEGSGYRFPILEEVRVYSTLYVVGSLEVPIKWGSAAPDAIFRAREADLLEDLLADRTRTRIALSACVHTATDRLRKVGP